MENIAIDQIISSSFDDIDSYTDNFAKIRGISTELLSSNGVADDCLVSLIIPTYCRHDLLKNAIDSVLSQEIVDFSWELIIIDNSPLDYCKQNIDLVQKITSIPYRYYHNVNNIGPGYSWNRAVELSSGRWVSFLHDDDELFPCALRILGEYIYSAPNFSKKLGYIHASRYIRLISGDLIKFSNFVPLELTRFGTIVCMHTQTGSPTCGTTILKEAYIKNGGINYDYGPTADAILGYQIMRNYSVISTKSCLGTYQWCQNHSLKYDTVVNLIQSDYLFMKYRCHSSKFGKIWGYLFFDIQQSINIEDKVSVLSESDSILLKKQINYVRPSNYCLKKKVYSLIRELYSRVITLKSKIKMNFCQF